MNPKTSQRLPPSVPAPWPVPAAQCASLSGLLFRRLVLALVLAVVGLVAMSRSSGVASVGGTREDYVLGPQDKVRIKVFEWRASRDEVYEWAALNAEYTVGAGGKVSLPLVGELAAAGKSPSELAAAIGKALKARINLVEPPDISIEVVQFRPFYILGDIERPGEYAYRPSLTVLQAIAIAGGMKRDNSASQVRLEREAISTKGALTLLETELMATLVRQARLASERDGLNEIEFPKDLRLTASGPVFGKMMEQETQLFHSRKDGFATQVWALEQLKILHEKEAQSLVRQLETHETHVRLVNEELDGVMQLYKQRLTTAPRKLALERNVALLQGDRVRLETSLARAYQEAGRTEIALLDLRNRRQTEITDELRKSQVRLDEIGTKLRTTEDLLYDTEVTAPRYVAMRTQARKNQPVFTVVRQSAGRSVEVQATETTSLEPGDTIKIEFPTPDPSQLEFARRRDNQAPASMSEEPAGRASPPVAPPGTRAGETPIRY